MEKLLAIDVGGTKCAVGIFSLAGEDFQPLVREVFLCREFSDIEEIIETFLGRCGHSPDVACLGIAGIVGKGSARMTNLTWTMDESTLIQRFSFEKVCLINDLTALCAAVPTMAVGDLHVLQKGEASNDIIGVLAPGTGLGMGYLLKNEDTFFPCGTEGGHTNFSPVNELQIELLRWLKKTNDVVSAEMVCAGPAIFSLYNFLRSRGEGGKEEIQRQLFEATDPTPVIVNGALEPISCPLCKKTVDLFLSLLGTEAGNLVLKLYSMGGLYLGGGILPRLVGKFSFAPFLKAFQNMGMMGNLIETVPVRLIQAEDAVLQGVVHYGRKVFYPRGHFTTTV